MSNSKYTIGTKVIFMDPQSGESYDGEVVPQNTPSEEVCVKWSTGLVSNYNEEWLTKFTVVKKSRETTQ